jgi:hypothetical protein
MNTNAHVNAYYDTNIVKSIYEKYYIDPMQALDLYLNSQTYEMFIDPDMKMTEFAPAGIFDMWEVEQVTGDPRNSGYISYDDRYNEESRYV